MNQKERDMQEIRKNLKEAAKWLNSAGKRIDSVGQGMDRMSQEMDRMSQEIVQREERYAHARAKENEEWNAKMNELRADIKKVNQMIGGHTHNVGSVTESHFVNSFEKYPCIGAIRFDRVLANQQLGSRRSSQEIDIMMLNGSYCAVVEVKYKCHPNDVTKYRSTRNALLSELRSLFPKEHYIFAIAADEFVEKAKHEALGAGLVVVERDGAELKIDDSRMEIY